MSSTKITAEKQTAEAKTQVEAEIERDSRAGHEDAEAQRRRRAQIAAYI
jgi:hypothetical protein